MCSLNRELVKSSFEFLVAQDLASRKILSCFGMVREFFGAWCECFSPTRHKKHWHQALSWPPDHALGEEV